MLNKTLPQKLIPSLILTAQIPLCCQVNKVYNLVIVETGDKVETVVVLIIYSDIVANKSIKLDNKLVTSQTNI